MLISTNACFVATSRLFADVMKVLLGSTVPRVDLDEIDVKSPPSHCFATTSGTQFDVRQGPNYAK